MWHQTSIFNNIVNIIVSMFTNVSHSLQVNILFDSFFLRKRPLQLLNLPRMLSVDISP